MATSPTPDRVTVLYDAIDAFQREHRTVGGLQHAQIRALLAEHLDRALPGVAPAADQPAGLRERIAMTLARTKLRPPYLHCLAMADAVLAELPDAADRAAVEAERDSLGREADRLRKGWVEMRARAERAEADRATVLNAAAQHLYTALFPAVYDDMGQKAAEGVNRAVSELRRMAAEARQDGAQQ